ncbi:myocardin-related transcription factor A isoform X2 [Varanus komodoensis]|uniref:myocardin-related transcription factor A isoform X2 n=1 Tax=Varanus komodoensis TaxID=61221 RepID=UPI001CF7BD96|nr:myocardin-related transcription factor A isoform X2 [Varanus komodoensis]
MLDKTKTLQPSYGGIVPFAEIVSKEGNNVGLGQDSYHNLREVLQLKLQQRRTREELVSQGIMPPLKSPAAFHEQRRSLERARTEDYLKRKIRSRPERSELVRMHILEETSAEPSLQAKQLKLKRARLADDLNEKIAQRPGPMELVEKNILPVESSLKEAIIGQVNYPKVADNSSFDEDSSDALSPEQPASHESQGSVPSPMEARVGEALPTPPVASPAQVVCQLRVSADSSEMPFLPEQTPPSLQLLPPSVPPSLTNGIATPVAKPLPTLIKQSQSKSSCEKSQRSKKSKEPKPKVKKLKYHQYIPPDQKQDKGAPPMDSSYAKILQQQQLFLQLQILNQQQQQHYNYQTILPAPPKPPGEQQSGSTGPPMRTLSTAASSSSSVTSSSNGLMRQNSNAPVCKPGSLPTNLDDMKVAELKQELKLRSLPVSGTKTDLIERLKAYQEQNGANGRAVSTPKPNTAILPKTAEVVVAFPATRLSTGPALVSAGMTSAEVVVATVTGNGVMKFGSTGSTPPVSPTPSERSLISAGDENSTNGDAFGEMVTSPLTQLTLQASPVQFLVKEESSKGSTCTTNLMVRADPCVSNTNRQDMEVQDKDQMLQEKDKQIEELTRMLKQKQQLVEMLKLQLEREKRSQQPPSAVTFGEEGPAEVSELPSFSTHVKSENGFVSCQSTGHPTCQTDQLKPTQTSSQMDTLEASSVPKKAVMVKQEMPAAETEPSCQTSSFFHGQQSGGFSELIKGAPPPTLITDSTGTHIVLTVTNQNAERQHLSALEKVGNGSLPLKRVSSPQAKASNQPVSSSQTSLQQPASEPMKKGQKLGLQMVTGQLPQTVLSFSAPPNLQPFFLNGFHKGPLKTSVPGKTGQSSVPKKLLSQPGSPTPPSPSQMDLEPQNFLGTPPPLTLPASSVLMKEPPGYEEAVKQQPKPAEENGCSSQQMDDLFDILIEHGEISAQFKEQSSPARKDTISLGCPSPSNSHHSSELPLQLSMGHTNSLNPSPAGRLEDFLESSTGLPLLTAGPDGPEPLSLIDLYSEMLSSSAILDHPSSPMDTSELHFAPEPTGGPSLDLAEANLDSMDWLELSGGPVMSLTPLSTATPSLFSTDSLDGHDLQLWGGIEMK